MSERKQSERVDVLPLGRLRIIQSEQVFSFSMDAVLLAHFATLPHRGKIADMCTGNGAVALMCTMRTTASIDGFDIQSRLVGMAKESARLNGVENQVRFFELEVADCLSELGSGVYDTVLCNPPYLPETAGISNRNEHMALARHEVKTNLSEVVRTMSGLVRPRGRVALVHRPQRLVDLLACMRKYRVEPKRMRLVYPKVNKEANIVLVEGIKDGSAELRVEPPLIAYKEDNTYTDEMLAIYRDPGAWGLSV
jgi:tRNA1(Val) A37 N6-methylase TrmN6